MIFNEKFGFETNFTTIENIGFDCRRVGDDSGHIITVNVLRMFFFCVFLLILFLSLSFNAFVYFVQVLTCVKIVNIFLILSIYN